MKFESMLKVSLCAAALALGQVSANAEPDEIKVGALITLSGPAAYLGDPVQKSLQLLVQRYNSQGGMNGRKLKLVTYDTEGNSGKAVQLYRRLVESDNVSVVMGPSSTGEAMTLLSVAEELKVPMVSFGAGKAIVSPVHTYVFKVPPTDELEIKQLVADLASRGVKKLAVLAESGPYGQSGLNLLKTFAPTAGLNIVAAEQFQTLDTDMTAQVVRVRDSNPDAVVIWAADPAATLVVKQAAALGLKKPIYNSPAVADPRFIEKAGGAADGTYVQSSPLLVAAQLPADSPQKAGLIWLTDAYHKQFSQLPPQNAGHAYDALRLIEQASKPIKGEVTGEAMAKGMEAAKFCGANGCYAMSSTDHNGLQPNSMVLLKAKGGLWTLEK